MSTWNIYHKDGTKLQDENGKEIVVHSLEYSDTWMGECFVTITFENEAPIDFAIGDYIEYRGEKFEINYDPGKIKVSSKNSYGAAFKYDSVKFNSLSDELARCEFLDVVLYDNNLHYTALPKFSFYVSTLDDLLDRILANLNEQIGENEWKLFSRNLERSQQRGCTEAEWNEMYGEGTKDNTIESKSITIDQKTCWEALALVNSEWDVNFIVRGRNIYVGTAGLPTANVFKYGEGNGLYEIEQNSESDQKVITRLRAYGSDKNLPSHYYADFGTKLKADISSIATKSSYIDMLLDLDYLDTYFKTKRRYSTDGGKTYSEGGWVLTVTFDYTTVITGYVTKDADTQKCRFYSEVKGSQDDNGDEASSDNLTTFISQCEAGKTLYITSGLYKSLIPSVNKEIAENLPNNMACSRLMLPGFPNQSLQEYWDSLTDDEKKYANPGGKEHKFSTNQYRPYIDSLNIDEIGMRQGSVYFDTDDEANGIIEIYPSMEEMTTSTGQRLDEIYKGSEITDDGRFDDGQTVNNFTIMLRPEIDFDINDLKQSDFAIHMQDGMCGGREFSVEASSVDYETGCWELTLARQKDDALEIYFPYKDYQINAGDHFVLTGIELPDSYVKAASLKLLKWAIAYLDENDYTRYVYQPKVDEIFMARQHDEYLADTTGKKKSLYLTLKAGDLLSFEDSDLNIEGEVSIDSLTIKEDEGKIPTYEITLREDKEVGTIQKIQNQVSSLASGNGSSSGGGATVVQTKSLVQSEGSKYFLSKIDDDTAQGLITFAQGLIATMAAQLKGGATFGNNGYAFDNNGNVVVNAINSLAFDEALQKGFGVTKDATTGKYTLSVTDLMVWGKAVFNSLEIRKLYSVGGNVYLSGASSKIQYVSEIKGTDGTVTGWKCYILTDDGTTATQNGWVKYDQAKCQTFDIQEGTYEGVSNTFYWRLVTDVSTENEAITETVTDTDGNETGTTLYDGKKFGWIVLSATDCEASTNDTPKAGDTIVLDGHRIFAEGDAQGRDQYNDTSRTNVMMLETTGTGNLPRIVALTNITDYKHSEDGNAYSNTVFILSPAEVVFVSSAIKWISASGDAVTMVNFRGAWVEGASYSYYDQVSHNNSIWTCIVAKGSTTTLEPTADNSSVWRMEITGTGDKGDDAVTYEVQVTSYSEWVNGGRAYGLQFQFVKVTGATRQTVADVREIGCMIKITTPAYIYSEAAAYINGGKSSFLFSAYPVGSVTMDAADNITVKMSLQSDTEFDNPVAVANFANGKQGKSALEISVSPDTLTFDTNNDGLVDSSTVQKATITCTRDGEPVTSKCTFSVMDGAVNCTGTFKATDDANVLTVGSITYQPINGQTVSNTNGYVNVKVTDEEGVAHTVTVRFTVNVAKFNSSMVANNKKYETVYNELTNNGSSTDLTWYQSKIEQTARNISLKVQEKNVGRRNMLTGSAFRKQEGGIFKIMGGFISINNGFEGTNCVHAVNTYSGSQNYYGVFWDGSQGGSSVKIDRTKKYVLSCWVKSDRTDVDIYLETVFTDKQTSASRVGKRPKVDKSKFGTTAASTWELIEAVIDPSLFDDGTTKNTQYEYMAVNVFCTHTLSGVTCHTYIARPMLEEGDEYNGWTLSEQDYDYVGGNLLDNTAKLTKTDANNIDTISGTVTQGGYGESAVLTESLAVGEYYSDILSFSTSGMGLKAGEDYILSFYAKASTEASAGKLQCYLYPSASGTNTEDSTGTDNVRNPEDGSLLYGIVPTTSWKRYWVHWRPTANDQTTVLFRLWRSGTERGSYSSTETYAVDDVVLYNGTYWRCKAASKGNAPSSSSSYWEATIYDVSIAQPKLEVGATMTEWTEKRADMVDKQALLATGIDIENKKITLTADNTVFQDNSGHELTVIDKDGLHASKISTVNSGNGNTVISGNTTMWYQKDGKTPGIAVFYDAAGVPHFQFYGTDGKVAYDFGPSGLQSFIDANKQAYSDICYLYNASDYVNTSGDTVTGISWCYEAKELKTDKKYIYRKQTTATAESSASDAYDGCVFTKEYSGNNWPSSDDFAYLLADGWYIVPSGTTLPTKISPAVQSITGETETVYYQTFYYYQSGKVVRTVKAYMTKISSIAASMYMSNGKWDEY